VAWLKLCQQTVAEAGSRADSAIFLPLSSGFELVIGSVGILLGNAGGTAN
jgi:hypothetical protein